jgi:hypothetical protein
MRHFRNIANVNENYNCVILGTDAPWPFQFAFHFDKICGYFKNNGAIRVILFPFFLAIRPLLYSFY